MRFALIIASALFGWLVLAVPLAFVLRDDSTAYIMTVGLVVCVGLITYAYRHLPSQD